MSTDRPMTRDELVAELVALRAELAQVKKGRDELKHDIERHLAIISEHLERAEKAEQELEQEKEQRAKEYCALVRQGSQLVNAVAVYTERDKLLTQAIRDIVNTHPGTRYEGWKLAVKIAQTAIANIPPAPEVAEWHPPEKAEQELATAQQENARLREALAWRPIETAPHHDWILLDCGNAGIVEGCYSTFEKEDAPRWFDSYGRTIYGPLHWIPLLDMPAARTALGGE